jgi:short-subunit dehydrogenase
VKIKDNSPHISRIISSLNNEQEAKGMEDQPVILITGASSGIGEATARKFAKEGYRVVLAARRFDRLQNLAEQIAAAGGQALPVEADVANLEDIQRLVHAVIENFGQIDVLFNNAGFGRLDWLENLDPSRDIEAQINVNLLGVIQTTRQVLPIMLEQHKGHIVNMASAAGLIASPTYTIYAASKFAVRGFTEALRREVGVYGIHVTAIFPGGVATEFKSHTGAKRKTGITTPNRIRLSADQVADVVWKVVAHPKRTVVIPGIYRLAVGLNAVLPGLIDWVIERRFVKVERGIK